MSSIGSSMPIPGSGKDYSVGDTEFHTPPSRSIPPIPPHARLPEKPSSKVSPGEIELNVTKMAEKGPKGSVLSEAGSTFKDLSLVDVVMRSTIGVTGKELKENFKAVWEKDKGKPPLLRGLVMSLRVVGVSLGLALNLISRVVAFAVAAAISPLILIGYTLAATSKMWKNPRKALSLIVGLGTGAGIFAGAALGTVGNLLVKHSLDMKYEKGEGVFSRATEDNVFVSLIGAGLTTGVCAMINPILYRAIWVKNKGLD